MVLQFLAAVRRLWLVALTGTLLTVGWCAFLWTNPPAYWTRSEVIVADAGVSGEQSILRPTNFDLVGLVAAVERVANEGRPVTRYMSRDASLYGLGVREGVSVSMLNEGTQWVPIFRSAILVVETVASTPDAALAANHEAQARVEAIVEDIQEEAGVLSAQRAHAVPPVTDPVLLRVGGTRRGQAMALAASAAVGGALTAGAIVLLDRRRRCRSASAGPARQLALAG